VRVRQIGERIVADQMTNFFPKTADVRPERVCGAEAVARSSFLEWQRQIAEAFEVCRVREDKDREKLLGIRQHVHRRIYSAPRVEPILSIRCNPEMRFLKRHRKFSSHSSFADIEDWSRWGTLNSVVESEPIQFHIEAAVAQKQYRGP